MFNSREEVINSAQIPDSYEDFEPVSLEKFYDRIYNFYDSKDNTITPYKYKVKSNKMEKKIKTTLGGVPNEDVVIKTIKDTNKKFSNYSKEHLSRVGIDEESTWNGQNASILYTYNGTMQFAETDFYTCSIFSRLLHLESLNSKISDISDMEARQRYAEDVDQFSDRPWFCTGGSLGGLVVGRTGENDYEAMIAKRSSDCFVNPNRYSIVPNTNLDPEQISKGLNSAIRKAFKDEVFNYRGEGQSFFNDRINPINVLNDWNLRDTKLTLNYMLLIDDVNSYQELKENVELRSTELGSPVFIDLTEPEEVLEYVNYEDMSPSVIPVILESIRYLQNNKSLPNYKIQRIK
jgi:hypothetical protein